MFSRDQYELLDFGAGRKLERFGRLVVDRPAGAAEAIAPSNPAGWSMAQARYERAGAAAGRWQILDPRRGEPLSSEPLPSEPLFADWTVEHEGLCFELAPSESGQVGLFPEQAANWEWIAAMLHALHRPGCRTVEPSAGHDAARAGQVPGRSTSVQTVVRPKVLNLFAYTGASTLAAARAGAEVVHVDAARGAIAWARRNAQRSGLAAAPIRWIADDALKFARRELRRGNRYDGVILDPPSYGHGPRGEPWKLDTGLAPLLAACAELLAEHGSFLVLSCHTTGLSGEELAPLVRRALSGGVCTAGPLELVAADGRALAAGVTVCWQSQE